ncbi:MAG TPA: MarR family winged helix-turn-helix transcriptional regulator, partial [Pusillimonas sp.]|uniref:MarR family winged helix-turn-helix transcriptional regulator n=1 Tax=Pusillimonas sp. TaxID=3040095 RepID=UPI002C6FCF07
TICLTTQGRHLIKKAVQRLDDVSEGTYNGISEIEKSALKYLLRCIANVELAVADKRDTGSVNNSRPVSEIDHGPVQVAPERRFRLRLEERVGHLLRRAYQRHVNVFQEYLSEFQLTAAQYIVLGTVLELGVCSQSDLARHTVIDHTTVRGIISRLGVRGLLLTEVDPEDARKVNVILTQSGRAVAQEAFHRIDSVSEVTYNGINDAERVALKFLLRRIADIPIPSGPVL